MITGDGIPGNTNTGNTDLNNGGLIFIIVLICIIAIMAVIMFIIWYNARTKINNLQKQFKEGITDDETNLLLKYKNLNDRDKTILKDTLKTLSQNNDTKKE